jgi:hypothetical protein
MPAEFGPTCIGVAGSAAIRVFEAGRNALITLPGTLGPGILARDGTVLIGRGLTVDLSRRPFTRLTNSLPRTPLTMSADGSRMAWRGQDPATGTSAVILYDRDTGVSSVGGPDGNDLSLSPDGRRLAITVTGAVQVYEAGVRLASFTGTDPSWWDDSTLAYLATPKQFRLTSLETMQSRPFRTVGRPLGPLQRSLRTGHILYPTRTVRDFWASPWKCVEQYRVLVQLSEGSTPVTYDFGCKGSSPASMQWINSPAVCAAAREQMRLESAQERGSPPAKVPKPRFP